VELTREQNISLVREYVKRHFVNAGMCADICIHDKNDGNPHAHIMLTMRPFNEDTTWGDRQKKGYILDPYGEKIYDKKKRSYKCKSIPTTDWNEQTKAEEWRQGWAETANNYLVMNSGTHIKIDHRSYERQGIEQIPTIHLGVAAHQMEKRGIRTERGNINREIEVNNQRLRQLKARIVKLQKWAKEETANTEPPTLADMIQDRLYQEQTLFAIAWSTPLVFPHFADNIPCFSVYDCGMGVLENKLFIGGCRTNLFVLVGFCKRLKVDRLTQVFGRIQNLVYRCGVPEIWVFTRPRLFQNTLFVLVRARIKYSFRSQHFCNLCGAVTVNT